MSSGNDTNNNQQPIIAKKRGRKSKKELELAAQQSIALQNITISDEEPSEKDMIMKSSTEEWLQHQESTASYTERKLIVVIRRSTSHGIYF